jgi:REP element-mobilizing transposase RayT
MIKEDKIDNSKEYHRRSIRLKEYDYSQNGAYFVTICTYNSECIFGTLKDGIIDLSSIGDIAYKFWIEIQNHFNNIVLDEFVIMPNHIHGIVMIYSDVGVQNFEPLQKQNRFQKIIPESIGSIIRTYKSAVTH